MRWWGRTRRSKRKNERRRCARRSHPEPFHSRLPALLHETHHGHTHATATRLDAGARTAVECCARHLPDRRVRSCRSSYRGSGTRGGSGRSAGRREGGGGVPLARHLPDRQVRSCRRSYRRAGTRGGSCRSAGRREGGDGVPLARHLPDRRVRSCRSSYRRAGTRGGSCRSAGRREGGGGVPLARHFPDRRVRSCRSSYRGPGRVAVHVGAPAGAKAAVRRAHASTPPRRRTPAGARSLSASAGTAHLPSGAGRT